MTRNPAECLFIYRSFAVCERLGLICTYYSVATKKELTCTASTWAKKDAKKISERSKAHSQLNGIAKLFEIDGFCVSLDNLFSVFSSWKCRKKRDEKRETKKKKKKSHLTFRLSAIATNGKSFRRQNGNSFSFAYLVCSVKIREKKKCAAAVDVNVTYACCTQLKHTIISGREKKNRK